MADDTREDQIQCFESTEGGANKFWEIALAGASFTTRYGRVGTAGSTTTKSFDTPEAARAAAEKLIREKTSKGYVSCAEQSAQETAPAGVAGEKTAAAPAETPKASSRAKTAAPAKPKALKKSSPEYQKVLGGLRDLYDSITDSNPFGGRARGEFAQLPERLAEVMKDANAAAIADAENYLARLASIELPVGSSLKKSQPDHETWAKGFMEANAESFSDPEVRAEFLNRWQTERDAHGAAQAAKNAALMQLVDAGCDIEKTKKGERTAAEYFVFTLVNPSYYPGAPFDQARIFEVLEKLIPRQQPAAPSLVLYDAAWTCRWEVFCKLLTYELAPESLLHAAQQLIKATSPGWTPPPQAEQDALSELFRKLAGHGPDTIGLACKGISFSGTPEVHPGALGLTLFQRRHDLLPKLIDGGLDINHPASVAFHGVVTISARHLPNQVKVSVERSFTALDVARRIEEVFEQYASVIGDRDPADIVKRREAERADAHKTVETLLSLGAKESGQRRALPPIQHKETARYGDFKPRLDLALKGLSSRLGLNEELVRQHLSTLEPGVFGPMHFVKDAFVKLSPFLPEPSKIDFSGCWLKELIGYSDSLAGADPEQAALYPEACRSLLRHGEWLGQGGSGDVAIHDGKTGKVYLASIERGLVELAPDLLTFLEQDLSKPRLAE